MAVQNNDIDKFKAKVPKAKPTTDTIAIKNAAGVMIDYTIFSVPDPPAKIDGTGVFSAGLMLLKVEGGDAKGAGKQGGPGLCSRAFVPRCGADTFLVFAALRERRRGENLHGDRGRVPVV